AAGFAVGALAGQVATVVKMVRILLLAPMVVFIGMRHHKDQSKEHQIGKKWRTFFPTFILYFLLMVILNTLGFFDYLDQITHLAIKEFLLLLSAFFMAMAMVGVGLNTDLKTLFKSGGKPLLAGGIAMVILSSVAAVLVLFID
ncbi:MAG: putative sulfate exporter family transporter, partial [Francisellaceae bacterium]